MAELVCPAGTPAALRAAVDAGADAVYLGFRDETNARNFPGLNFSREELAEGVAYAHVHGGKVFLAVNTFAQAGRLATWRQAIDDAAALGIDAAIVSDIGVLDYAASARPELRLHLSVQASAAHAEALVFYQERFGIRRAVLPRVLTVEQVKRVTREAPVETEVFVYGGLCPMAEGRCALSSYATGRSPNTAGVCSPASHVRYVETDEALVTRLGAFTIGRVAPGDPAGYPTLCKGRFEVRGKASHIFEDPVSLDARSLLPTLVEAGVTAFKIEGRQRGRAYVAEVVTAVRGALREAEAGVLGAPASLAALSEGRSGTDGAYRKTWR